MLTAIKKRLGVQSSKEKTEVIARAFMEGKYAREIERMSALIEGKKHQAPIMPTLVSHPRFERVWRIPVPNQADVYMFGSPLDYVVYARAEAFYRAWLRLGPWNYQACPFLERMRQDHKYYHAASCFKNNYESPVPLAMVNLHGQSSDGIAINFSDGITRSLWLLSNYVDVFPIACESAEIGRVLEKELGVVSS